MCLVISAPFFVKMFIHNVSFIIDPRKRDEFLRWVSPRARDAAGDLPSRLSVMRQAGGEDAKNAQALSIAFQAEFNTMTQVVEWVESELNPLIAEFEKRFAPEGMAFTSIFETVEYGLI